MVRRQSAVAGIVVDNGQVGGMTGCDMPIYECLNKLDWRTRATQTTYHAVMPSSMTATAAARSRTVLSIENQSWFAAMPQWCGSVRSL
jgi:hypothetical protein